MCTLSFFANGPDEPPGNGDPCGTVPTVLLYRTGTGTVVVTRSPRVKAKAKLQLPVQWAASSSTRFYICIICILCMPNVGRLHMCGCIGRDSDCDCELGTCNIEGYLCSIGTYTVVCIGFFKFTVTMSKIVANFVRVLPLPF